MPTADKPAPPRSSGIQQPVGAARAVRRALDGRHPAAVAVRAEGEARAVDGPARTPEPNSSRGQRKRRCGRGATAVLARAPHEGLGARRIVLADVDTDLPRVVAGRGRRGRAGGQSPARSARAPYLASGGPKASFSESGTPLRRLSSMERRTSSALSRRGSSRSFSRRKPSRTASEALLWRPSLDQLADHALGMRPEGVAARHGRPSSIQVLIYCQRRRCTIGQSPDKSAPGIAVVLLERIELSTSPLPITRSPPPCGAERRLSPPIPPAPWRLHATTRLRSPRTATSMGARESARSPRRFESPHAPAERRVGVSRHGRGVMGDMVAPRRDFIIENAVKGKRG